MPEYIKNGYSECLCVMCCLRETFHKNNSELGRYNSLFLDHWKFVTGAFVPHPSYSPDLALSDVWFFNKLKQPLRTHRFNSIEDIKPEQLKVLKTISKKKNFNNCKNNRKISFSISVSAESDYLQRRWNKLQKIAILIIRKKKSAFNFFKRINKTWLLCQ